MSSIPVRAARRWVRALSREGISKERRLRGMARGGVLSRSCATLGQRPAVAHRGHGVVKSGDAMSAIRHFATSEASPGWFLLT